jgi:ferric-dicitrate binding protein FerR (iron transport regulator)
VEVANSLQDTLETAHQWFNEMHLMETPPRTILEQTRIGLEAHQEATREMLDLYQRMGIPVTPEMTRAPAPEPKARKAAAVRK